MKYDEVPALKNLASKYGFEPSKTYGQNFLIDETVIQKILSVAHIKKTDSVVEVGPGFGVLTRALSEVAGEVYSFEIEKKLLEYWEKELHKYPNIKIFWGNVLKTFPDFCENFSKEYFVVANLPYQITSPVIRMFLEATHPPKKLTLMVQKEVGERICADPGDMSLLAVSVQYYCDVKFEFKVPASAFWPYPRVDSAVININHRKEKVGAEEEKWFFSVVKQGFSNRRKLLIKNLSGLSVVKNKAELLAIFDKLSLLKTARAQELSVQNWRELALELKNS